MRPALEYASSICSPLATRDNSNILRTPPPHISSSEERNVIIRAINNWSNLVAVTDWGDANSRFLELVSVGAARLLDQITLNT